MNLQLSDAGEAFIKRRESCRLQPHWDAVAKVWDIGYGHRFKPGEPRVAITQEEADALFHVDSLYYSDHVNAVLTVEIDQPMFDCVVSLTYNIGHDALAKSTFLQYVNAEMFADAVIELLTWNKSDGKFVDGLLYRRAKEALMFARGEYHE